MDLPSVNWALTIVDSIVISKVSQQELEWDMVRAMDDGAWFLPQKGEWEPPLNVTQLQMRIPMPPRPTYELSNCWLQEGNPEVLECNDGALASVTVMQQLWYLLLVYVQSADDSSERRVVARHVRSLGWRLFFCCSGSSLTQHVHVVSKMADNMTDIPPDDDEAHKHMRARGDIREQYSNLSTTLASLWNKTGDWFIKEMS